MSTHLIDTHICGTKNTNELYVGVLIQPHKNHLHHNVTSIVYVIQRNRYSKDQLYDQ